MFMRRFLSGLLSLCWAASALAGPPEDAFTRDLATAREEAYVMPGETVRKLEALQSGRTGQALGQVLVELSPAYYWHGDKRKAVDAALQAERIARAGHDDALLAGAMLDHAFALSNFVHDQDTAHRLVEEAAQLAANLNDTWLQTRALVAQGRLAEDDGRIDDGIALVARAVALARSGADPDALSMALREHARQLSNMGDDLQALEQALRTSDELIALAQARKIPAQLARAWLSEYAIAARAGRAKRAESALVTAVDILQTLHAKERLAVPLANLAALYIQTKRYGEAERASRAALRIARDIGDAHDIQLAAFEAGMTRIHFRDIATGRRMVEHALDALKSDEQYVPLLLDYGHALNQVGEGDVALTIIEKAGSVSLAAWRKEKQLSYQALQRAYAYQKKQAELAALHHDSVLKAADLKNTQRQRMLWVLLTGVTLLAALVISLLYRRVAKANRALKVKNEQLFTQSTRDSLTGLFNRHYFYEHVVPLHHGKAGPAVLERRTQADEQAGGVFLLFDIDHFKSINDRFGHSAGDAVLRTVAARLATTLREQDVLIRWGGEEFLAYLPGLGTEDARQVCARLLAAVSGTTIPVEQQALTVTISIGFCPKVVDGADTDPDWEQLVHLADLCLYLAKTGGRNQAFGISDASTLTPEAISAADADMKQASLDGLVDLLNVKL
jgi:diguanylate cyclase (GGDEF)-like protein